MSEAATQTASQGVDERPILLFFSSRRSGPARRMSSLVAWVRVTEKRRLRVVEVDADTQGELAETLGVSVVPSLVLLRGAKVVGRLDGKSTGAQIAALIEPHVA
jgi:thioredoxin-like negative regulator of GroEL